MSTLAQGHANLLCIVPKTLTETKQSKKETKIQRCSEPRVQQMVHCCRPDSNDTKDTRDSAGSRRKHTVTRKNVCSRQHCQPLLTFDTPKPDARTAFNKDGEKHGQREPLESRDIRQVPNKRRVDVQGQNRDSLIRDVSTCLACTKTLPRSLTTLEETRRCHSYFIRMISRTSSESDSSRNRVSNATDSVNGLISSKSS